MKCRGYGGMRMGWWDRTVEGVHHKIRIVLMFGLDSWGMFSDFMMLATGHVEVNPKIKFSNIKSQKNNYISCPKIRQVLVQVPYISYVFWISLVRSSLFTGFSTAGAVVPVILDVTLEDTVVTAARFIQEEQQPLVGLVNCAGLSRRLPLELEPMEAVKELYEVTQLRVGGDEMLLGGEGGGWDFGGSEVFRSLFRGWTPFDNGFGMEECHVVQPVATNILGVQSYLYRML